MSQLSTYQRFFSTEEAAPVIEVLQAQQIPFSFIEIVQPVGTTITGESPSDRFELKIPACEFEKVDDLLLDSFSINLEELEKDHYLYSFTSDELENILHKPDEWGKQDYRLARKLLQQQGISFTDEELEAMRKRRNNELARPEKIENAWIGAGYFFSLLGGLIGILIGLSILQSVKTLPDGRKVYTYSDRARWQARRIIFIASFVFILFLLLRLGSVYSRFIHMFGIH